MRALRRTRDIIAVLLVGSFGVLASGSHTVRSGETLGSIAVDHGVSVRELVDANGLANPDLILIGQKLTIPGAAGTVQDQTHVVQRGESLALIAGKYGTTVRAIADANGISNVDLIRIGQTLAVPAGSSGGSSTGSSGSSNSSSGSSNSSSGLAGQRHTVQSGESLASIARRYGLSSSAIAEWNGIVNGVIYATTRLVLYNPGSLPVTTSSSGPVSHVVRSGETLSGIAARYGSSSRAIASANGITDVNKIVVGQQLSVPGVSGGSVHCPVPGASFFNDWAFPRSGGRSHAGNDLFAARGTPVYAPVAGVVEVQTGTIGGKQFRLTDAQGNLWFGSHMDAFGATGRVNAGAIIGYVGDSGNAKGSSPHLHFEIHPAGTNAVNPYPLLRSVC